MASPIETSRALTLLRYRTIFFRMKFILCLLALLSLGPRAMAASEFSPMTKHVHFTLQLNAPPAAAFPLFDPVNETKWDPDWKPQLLGDRVEEGLVFLVGDGRDRTTWLLDRYEPNAFRIAYVVAARSTLTRINIALEPRAGGSTATVTYTKTALDSEGVTIVDHFIEHFPSERRHWESAINAVLDRT